MNALCTEQTSNIFMGYLARFDITRRYLQLKARGKCRPWDADKIIGLAVLNLTIGDPAL